MLHRTPTTSFVYDQWNLFLSLVLINRACLFSFLSFMLLISLSVSYLNPSGDPALKSSTVDEDDISPLNKSFLMETEDQNSTDDFDDFVPLSPPAVDDYLFALGDNEGISDLFDAYDIF